MPCICLVRIGALLLSLAVLSGCPASPGSGSNSVNEEPDRRGSDRDGGTKRGGGMMGGGM
jgi:hypothetical protein